MIRRGTAILLLVLSLASTGCGGAQIAANDEVTTRMNARDEQALDDGAPPHDAGATPVDRSASP